MKKESKSCLCTHCRLFPLRYGRFQCCLKEDVGQNWGQKEEVKSSSQRLEKRQPTRGSCQRPETKATWLIKRKRMGAGDGLFQFFPPECHNMQQVSSTSTAGNMYQLMYCHSHPIRQCDCSPFIHCYVFNQLLARISKANLPPWNDKERINKQTFKGRCIIGASMGLALATVKTCPSCKLLTKCQPRIVPVDESVNEYYFYKTLSEYWLFIKHKVYPGGHP